MKIVFLSLLLTLSIYSFANAAELVTCTSEKGDANVSFNLEGKEVSNFVITSKGNVVMEIPSITANQYRFLGRTYYELDFDHSRYFDFDRKNSQAKEMEGHFLLKRNPFAFETGVDCIVE